MLPPAGRNMCTVFITGEQTQQLPLDTLPQTAPTQLTQPHIQAEFSTTGLFSVCGCMCAWNTRTQTLWALQTAGSFDATKTSISLLPSLLLIKWRELEKKIDDAAFLINDLRVMKSEVQGAGSRLGRRVMAKYEHKKQPVREKKRERESSTRCRRPDETSGTENVLYVLQKNTQKYTRLISLSS